MQLLDIRKFGFLLVLLLSSALIIVSCGDDDDDDDKCETTDLTYDNYAKQFLKTNCVRSGCHDADAIGAQGSFENYEDTKTVVDVGRMKGAINHEEGISDMPKGETKLSDCDISKLSAWLDAGAPE